MIDIAAFITLHALAAIFVMVLSALPLYFAVKLVGGETGIVKIILIGIVLSFASLGAFRFIGVFSGFFILAATLVMYKMAFRISFPRAFAAWALQYVFVLIALLFVAVLS